MEKIIGIHGTSSKVIFECEDVIITASGEFLAKDGTISGFVVLRPSLKYENGEFLTSQEQEDLILRYEEYEKRPDIRKDWSLEFD